MSQIGSLIQYAIKAETTPGTYAAPTSTSGFLPNAGGDFDTIKEKVELVAGYGRIEDISQSRTAMLMGQGKIVTPVGIEKIGQLLMAIFGQAPTTTGSGPYVHTFALKNDNNHQSFTIVRVDPESGYRAFTNCLLDTFSIDAEKNGEFLVIDSTWKGKGEDNGQTPVTPAYSSTESLITPDQITVKEASNVAGLSGATASVVEKLSISGNKNVVTKGALGSTAVVKVHNGRFSISGTIETEYNGDTDRLNALTSSTRAIQITFTVGSYSLVLTLNQVGFDTPKLSTDLDGLAVLTRSFKAERISGGMITAVLTNNISAYPLV